MTIMQCGHTANATDDQGAPVCVIHVGTSLDAEARTPRPEPDLTGRKAKCPSCGRVTDTSTSLAFLRLHPDHDPGAGRYDTFYDGCRGWD